MSDNTLNHMESKNIKDYLHLYLGCEVAWTQVDSEAGKLVGISASEVEPTKTVAIIDYGTPDYLEWYIEETKPILRPLSDMTEEEQIQLQLKLHPNGYLMDAMANEQRYFSFETTRQLLSKGFDLFGLIDAGIAMKKSQ